MPRILICTPYRASTHPDLVARWEANAAATGQPSLLMRDHGDILPGDGRYSSHARARNQLLDSVDLGGYDYLYWIDVDIIDWPSGLLNWALTHNSDGVSAPAALLDHHQDRWFDIWGYIEQGRPARPYRPWFDQAGPIIDLDSVGCCYVIPAAVYQSGARYANTPGERTEHYPVMQAARDQGRRVVANVDFRAVHAFPVQNGQA